MRWRRVTDASRLPTTQASRRRRRRRRRCQTMMMTQAEKQNTVNTAQL